MGLGTIKKGFNNVSAILKSIETIIQPPTYRKEGRT